MKLIDADLLGLTDMEIIMCDGDYKEALKMLIDKIDSAPAIEPDWTELTVICDNCGHAIHVKKTDAKPTIEPERKTGKWIYHKDWDDDGECGYECSECGMGSEVDYNYCMRCGAYMMEESKRGE